MHNLIGRDVVIKTSRGNIHEVIVTNYDTDHQGHPGYWVRNDSQINYHVADTDIDKIYVRY